MTCPNHYSTEVVKTCASRTYRSFKLSQNRKRNGKNLHRTKGSNSSSMAAGALSQPLIQWNRTWLRFPNVHFSQTKDMWEEVLLHFLELHVTWFGIIVNIYRQCINIFRPVNDSNRQQTNNREKREREREKEGRHTSTSRQPQPLYHAEESVAHYCWSNLGTMICFMYQFLNRKHVTVPGEKLEVASPIS